MIRKLPIWMAWLAIALVSSAALAQVYPIRPIRLIVPFGPGAPDSVARIVGQQLSAQLGQPFVIENRAGANGIIGADVVAKSPPDGYTLLLTTVSFAVNPSMQRKLPFDAVKDFTPITNICDQEAVFLVINPALRAQSVQDFIALAKRPDSRFSYSSIGVGNTTHLAAELFNARTGIKAVHVPYKGGAAAVSAVIAGDVQMMLVPPTQSLQFVKAGKLRALAYTHRTRSELLPEVPTMAEAGVADMEFAGGWFGLFAPSGTSPEIAAKLANEARTAVNNPQVKERLAGLGLRPVGTGPAEFRLYVEREIKYFAELMRMTGIEPE